MMIGAKAPILCIYRTNTQYVDKIVDNCTMTQIISRKEARKMTLKEILGTSGGILFVLSVLVQIAPIKLNPWSTLARYIGRALNSEVLEIIEKNEAKTARYRIIRFNDEIRHDVRHTEEHFNQIIDDIRTYENYCNSHPNFPNGKSVFSVSNIKKIYEKCISEDLFI